ncbi:hypothetical protein B0T25DRAFT_633929, partial [Lasiosphaeria hispida]
MLRGMAATRDISGLLDPAAFGREMTQLRLDDVLAVMVKGQNAGLFITHHGSVVSFESFELLASDSAASSCEGRLRRLFPGPSATVSHGRVADATFCEPLAEALAKMDHERAPSEYPHSRENQSADPRLVTEMIMGVLRGIGQSAASPSVRPAHIRKHTREEIVAVESSLWRRSPLWLLVRVSLQLTIERSVEQVRASRPWYKEFIIFFLSLVVRDAAAMDQPHDMLFMMVAKVSRRILKLKPAPAPWLAHVEGILMAVRSKLEKAWAAIQTSEHDLLDLSPLGSLSFADDIDWKLTTLRPYLDTFSARPLRTEAAHAAEADDHNPRTYSRDRFPDGEFSVGNESLLLYELADFEKWIESHLQASAESDGASTFVADGAHHSPPASSN